ncbi:flagellar hook-length control protein FliK [Janthinobacterium sp. 17J80-10]|uniref:flagellar hook-length control protein FliK n=1 Tax=Janthinobacterium sp. 17J80-10 TaxID=2497863 RepID=UPI0010057BC3|nr:flagellar hook-length control protein FliK [Janthinobacterium sp. 17J80-10]QAU34361.1 flagellar hook-length control protein FliK [Janthinobacterium sp. 17J80-10]
MQTPAILNVSSPAGNQAVSTKPAAGASNGGFNQMLSQQIADRREADKSAQPRGAGQTGKNESKQADTKQTNAKQPESSQAANNAGSSAGTKSRETEEQTDETAAIPPTATELMTQVAANLLLPQATAEASATAGDAIAAVNGAALAREQGLLASAAPGKELPGSTAGDQGDFLAALRQAAEPQDTPLQAAIADAAGSGNEQMTEALPELSAATSLQDASTLATTGAATQPAALSASQAAGAEATDRLAPRFGSPAWDQALGQKVVWMVAGAQQSASLTLNPPDLGPLQVVLNVSNGQADASFFSAQPEVRQALEAALPRLRDMMSEAGVALGQTSISAGMPDRHDQPGSHAAHRSVPGAGAGNGDAEAVSAPAPRVGRVIGGQGLVDTFA